MTGAPFSRLVDIRGIGAAGLRETVAADAGERAAVAADFGILALGRLEAAIVLSVWNRVGLKLDGRLLADAVQACVVTLEPVGEHIDQPFSLTFLPLEAQASEVRTVAEAEVVVDFDADDPPDPLVGPTLDLGAIVIEQLALALDPYPRAPGAELQAEIGDKVDAPPSPFAALTRLKKD